MVYSSKTLVGWLIALLLATIVDGLAISYCSSENTAGNQAQYSNYMSNGLCQDDCGNYAYAVLQGGNCWCSDYAPQEQVNTLDCNQVCPGWPDDWCGSTSAGLFGYYQLSVAPSGTAGGSATPSSSSISSSYVAPSTSSTPSQTPSPTPTPTSTSTSTPTTQITSSSPSTTPTNTPTQIYTSVMTVTGQVKTVVVTPTSTPESSPLGQASTGGGGVSTGKVVGIVLGVALGLGILIGLAVWFWLRRKHQNQSRASSQNGTYAAEDGDPNRTAPSRQVSQMSSSGLLGKAPRILTAGYGPSSSSNNPRSPDTVSSNGIDRRSLGTDQRLNPYAIYTHEEARLSSVSLQDNQDYSRQLRIANPD